MRKTPIRSMEVVTESAEHDWLQPMQCQLVFAWKVVVEPADTHAGGVGRLAHPEVAHAAVEDHWRDGAVDLALSQQSVFRRSPPFSERHGQSLATIAQTLANNTVFSVL